MVKFADGPTTTVSATIDAPAARVWPWVTDIELPSRFSEEFQRAVWLDDGPAPGARFQGFNRRGGFEWDVICTVTALDEERVFEWTVGPLDDRVARWRFDLTADGTDASTLTLSAELGPGPSGLTMAIERAPDREEEIVDGRLAELSANMRRTVDGVKALAEGH